MMKSTALLLACLVSISSAFAPASIISSALTLMQGSNAPMNGGAEGSNMVPSQYGQIDHIDPYGNSRALNTRDGQRQQQQQLQQQQEAPGRRTNASLVGGPVNGGVEGSSQVPGQYGQIDHTTPYGTNAPQNQPGMTGGNRPRTTGRGSGRRNKVEGVNPQMAPRQPGFTGGTSGSSMVPDQHDRIDHTSPY